MRVLFWNVHKNDSINQMIANAIEEYRVDIVVLAEYQDNIENLIQHISDRGILMQKYLSAGCEKIVLFGTISAVEPKEQGNRFSIQVVRNEYILCGLHLPSQLYSGSEDRRKIDAADIVRAVESLEEELGTSKTILVGDMNEDPYGDTCLSANYFHGLPSRRDVETEDRIIEGKPFKKFYNPMWNFFGDFTSPPGTYYYAGSNPKNPFWHIFDQVILRPALKEQFLEDELKIITEIGTVSLLDEKGHPNKAYSDHLPIVFELKEELS